MRGSPNLPGRESERLRADPRRLPSWDEWLHPGRLLLRDRFGVLPALWYRRGLHLLRDRGQLLRLPPGRLTP